MTRVWSKGADAHRASFWGDGRVLTLGGLHDSLTIWQNAKLLLQTGGFYGMRILS